MQTLGLIRIGETQHRSRSHLEGQWLSEIQDICPDCWVDQLVPDMGLCLTESVSECKFALADGFGQGTDPNLEMCLTESIRDCNLALADGFGPGTTPNREPVCPVLVSDISGMALVPPLFLPGGYCSCAVPRQF